MKWRCYSIVSVNRDSEAKAIKGQKIHIDINLIVDNLILILKISFSHIIIHKSWVLTFLYISSGFLYNHIELLVISSPFIVANPRKNASCIWRWTERSPASTYRFGRYEICEVTWIHLVIWCKSWRKAKEAISFAEFSRVIRGSRHFFVM